MVAIKPRVLYGRVIGSVEWVCPYCYGINKDAFGPRGPRSVRCNRKDCNRHYAVGLIFHQMVTGPKIPWFDVFLPGELACERLRSGQAVNRVISEEPSETSLSPIEDSTR